MQRVTLFLFGILVLLAAGPAHAENPFNTSERMVQIESRPGIQIRTIIYRPERPSATVVLFPDGNGRLDITHVFNDPSWGRSEDIPLELMGHLLDQGLIVVLMDAPTDHRSMLGVNGWHGPNIFRLSKDHARDIDAVIDYLNARESLPVWLVGIRMGAFSAATAAIQLQEKVNGLVIAGGITQCPEQKILLQLCPQGLMGMPLHEITVPTLILSGGHAFPEALLASALNHSPSIRFHTFPEFVDFESWGSWDATANTIPGVSNADISREMTDFIRWNQINNPVIVSDTLPKAIPDVEIYLVGCCY
jgi:pimeloyl-ACP methyl ester carboxylesterase